MTALLPASCSEEEARGSGGDDGGRRVKASSSTAVSRILDFWILPVTVIGKLSTNFQ